MIKKMSWKRKNFKLVGIIFFLIVIATLLVPATSRAIQFKLINVSALQENNILTIENPKVNDETEDSKIIGWRVTDNDGNLLNEEDYEVRFESSGFILNNENDNETYVVANNYLDEEGHLFFRYIVGENDSFDNETLFKPSQVSTRIGYTKGKLKLRYSPEQYGDKKWYELLAGTYRDTITITVTAKNE